MFGFKKKKDFDISLEDLEVAETDLGSSWHPKHLAEDGDGALLEDIPEGMMIVHLAKEERLNQADAVTPLESTPLGDELGKGEVL